MRGIFLTEWPLATVFHGVIMESVLEQRNGLEMVLDRAPECFDLGVENRYA
jgi:hypothetical protein